MAGQLPAHLSYKSALVLLPPFSIAAPIEAVRRAHDKQFYRWPAHINLLYPFVSSPSEPGEPGEGSNPILKHDIRVRIERAVRNIQPFRISLSADPPGIFHHSQKSKTVWLPPTTHYVQDLHVALQAELLDVNADRRPFEPHLSVGQARTQNGADKLSAEIKNSVSDFLSRTGWREGAPIALDWYVDKVCVIERKGYRDRFRVIGTIELGKE
jgi:hypothetical protein